MLRGTGLRLSAPRYNYQYMDQSPYEILSNNVLPFSDVVRIKHVEDILEKFWNDHRMDETIEFLVEHCYDTPFDFSKTLGRIGMKWAGFESVISLKIYSDALNSIFKQKVFQMKK